MYGTIFAIKMNKLLFVRSGTSNLKRYMSTPPGSGPGPSIPPESAGASIASKYRPSELQKLILVWTKKYKSKAEIPTYVSLDLIEKSRSQARIKIANIMMLLTALASLGAVLSGKAAAKRGESITTINQEFHQKYKEDFEKKQVAQTK